MAERQEKELKKHGDALSSEDRNSKIPAPDDGGHLKSAAAHQSSSKFQDTAGVKQHHVPSNEIRQPPQEISRAGKQHR